MIDKIYVQLSQRCKGTPRFVGGEGEGRSANTPHKCLHINPTIPYKFVTMHYLNPAMLHLI